MKKENNLGALFYPKGTKTEPIPFDTLYIPFIYKEIYLDGVYVDICNQKTDMTCLDVGANIGIVSQHLRDYSKKVYAIEPSSEHFAALKKNKEFNSWENVEIFNMALAANDGEMMLNKLDSNRTCHSLINDHGQGGEKVRTMAFDTFFKENKIDHIDFCKFDVEGAEDLILRSEGFKKVADKISAIMVEFHYPTWPQLVEYMTTLGFTARKYDSSAIIILFTK